MALSTWIRRILLIALAIGMTGAVARAGKTKFWEKRKAMSQADRADQERLGLSGGANRKALYARYPTPEVTLCKPIVIAPGSSAPLTLTGRFPEKTTFLVANDQVEIEEGTLAAGRFTTKATVAADAAAGYAPIYAITPVSGANTMCPAVFIGPISSYELSSTNGWTIKLTPQGKAFEVGKEDARLTYTAAFSKEGETAPFKKMSARLVLRFDQETGKEVYLSLEPLAAEGSPDAELAAIQKKMADPSFAKLPPAEMEKLMKRMEVLMKQQIQERTAPDYAQKAQKEQDDFGCQSMSLTVSGGEVNGHVQCGKNVGRNGDVRLTGTSARVS
jgi:Protein of unknown function (DUF3617)